MNSADLIQFYQLQINKLRNDPSSFLNILEDRLQRFNLNNQFSHYQFGNILFETNEGKTAVKETIDYIKSEQKMKCLNLSQNLCEAAYKIGLQIEKTLPDPIDLNLFKDQIKKEVKRQIPHFDHNVEAIIEYGFRKDLDLLTTILVDDGNFDRTRRHVLMNPSFRSIGISIHEHNQFDFFVLFLFSEYVDKPTGCSCEVM